MTTVCAMIAGKAVLVFSLYTQVVQITTGYVAVRKAGCYPKQIMEMMTASNISIKYYLENVCIDFSWEDQG